MIQACMIFQRGYFSFQIKFIDFIGSLQTDELIDWLNEAEQLS